MTLCSECHNEITRKMQAGGYLESESNFLSKKTCSIACGEKLAAKTRTERLAKRKEIREASEQAKSDAYEGFNFGRPE